MRARLFIPTAADGGADVQVIVVLRGEHSHVYPVLKPPTTLVSRIVKENMNQPVKILQVCWPLSNECEGGCRRRGHCFLYDVFIMCHGD